MANQLIDLMADISNIIFIVYLNYFYYLCSRFNISVWSKAEFSLGL